MQKIVGKVFFDDVALVTGANHKIIDAMGAVDFEDVPQDGTSTDFHHWLGAGRGFFGQAGAKASGKDDGFHGLGRLRIIRIIGSGLERASC
jgi:hypothetical protein